MGISITQLLIILAIVLLLFGTKKLRSAGGDIGGFIRNFKSSMKDDPKPEAAPEKIEQADDVIEGKATREQDRQV